MSNTLSCHLGMELSWKSSVTLPIKNVWACDTRFSHMCQFQMASKRQQVMPTSHTRAKWWPTPESPLTRLYAEIKKQSIKEEIRTDVGEGSTLREREREETTRLTTRGKIRVSASKQCQECLHAHAHVLTSERQRFKSHPPSLHSPHFHSYTPLQTPLNLMPCTRQRIPPLHQ